jgi:hypothetical protein
MSTLDLSRRAMRGEDDAMARLIRSLADDLYECRPSDLERTRAELERTFQEFSSENAHWKRELKALWELTHVFLSKVPLSLQPSLELPADSVETAILNLIESDEALTLDEICEFSSLEEGAVQEALNTLERLGLVIPLFGEARRLTRDGREVKRWICSRDAAGKARKETDAPALPRPARSKTKHLSAIGAGDSVEASRRLVSGFDKNLRAKLRLANVHLRETVGEEEARQQESVYKRSLLRIAGSDLQVLRQKEVRELEGKVLPGTEIWVIGVTSPNGGDFFDIVADNIIHSDIQYFYVCSEQSFKRLWDRLAEKCGEDHLRRRLACIMNAPELLHLDTARIHILPDEKMRLMRVCWLGLDKPETFYLAASTPTAFPYLETLRSYRRAVRNLIAKDPTGLPVLDFQKLETKVRSRRPKARARV